MINFRISFENLIIRQAMFLVSCLSLSPCPILCGLAAMSDVVLGDSDNYHGQEGITVNSLQDRHSWGGGGRPM